MEVRHPTTPPAYPFSGSTTLPEATPLHPSITPAQAAMVAPTASVWTEIGESLMWLTWQAASHTWLEPGASIQLLWASQGGSAGGYTALQSLYTYPRIWASGVSEYDISNMFTLEESTHKFESQYMRRLLLLSQDATEEEKEKVYRESSPIFQAQNIKAPLLMLQGSEDCVVPLEQATEMEKVVREKGGDVRLVVLEGEGHGFRRGENVKRAIEEEERWWIQTLLEGLTG